MEIYKKEKKLTQRSMNAQETKNAIYNSAIYLFSKYGYDRVTIEKITDHAGVSKGNFYTHFESKESVFVELFHRIDSHYIDVLKLIDQNQNAGGKLRTFINSMSDYCCNVCGIDAIKVVYANQISTSNHVKILINKDRPFYYFLRNIANEGQFSREFRTDMSTEDLVELIARYCRALLYDWCLYNNEFNLMIETERYVDFILDSIKYK